MGKRSKHPYHDDPTAFKLKFPTIREVTDGSVKSPLDEIAATKYYKMNKVWATVTWMGTGFHMSVRCNNRYPTWDEIVWLRYNLIPDAAVMSLVLPNLNSYINNDETGFKYVFTMEQKAWALDPTPRCPLCNEALRQPMFEDDKMRFTCACSGTLDVDPRTWNEEHGNGLKAGAR